MSPIDEALGRMAGPAVASALREILEQHGGLNGLVEGFEKQGLGEIVTSWVGNGPNLRISVVQMHLALGAGNVQQMAARARMPVPELLHKLTAYLPLAVDRMTPGGALKDP